MSEAMIAELTRQLIEERAKVKEVTAEAKGHRLKRKAAEGKLSEATKRIESLEGEVHKFKTKADEPPTDKDAEIERLRGEVRTRDHRDAWGPVKDQLHDKVTLEKVWSEIGYKPGDKTPTAEQVAEQVAKARETAPYLFKPAVDGQEAPRGAQADRDSAVLPPGPGFARGGSPNDVGFFTVRRADLNNQDWMERNQTKLAEAGDRVRFVD